MPTIICNKCDLEQEEVCFSKEPIPSNPDYRRKTCRNCRNKYKREYAKKTDYHKKQYKSMSDEKRVKYLDVRKKRNKTIREKDPEAYKKTQRKFNQSDRGIFSRYAGDCKRRGRLKRGIKMELTFEQFQILISNSCHYCNKENCRGVDRVDSDKSYTIDNSVPCCKICNQMKNDLPVTEFLDHIHQISQHSTK